MDLFRRGGTYDASGKMTDKNKLWANRAFADQVAKLTIKTPYVVVLDAETLLSSRIVHKRVPHAKIVAVSEDAHPTLKVPKTTFVGGYTLADVLSFGGPGRVYRDECVDAFFLDHCGGIKKELRTLEDAFVSLRHGRPCIIAATYSFRMKGGVKVIKRRFLNTLEAKLRHYIADGELTVASRIDILCEKTYPQMYFIMVRVDTHVASESDIFYS